MERLLISAPRSSSPQTIVTIGVSPPVEIRDPPKFALLGEIFDAFRSPIVGEESPGVEELLVIITPVGLVGRIPKPVSTNRPVSDAVVFFKFAGVRFITVGTMVRSVSIITVLPEMISSPYEGASLAHG